MDDRLRHFKTLTDCRSFTDAAKLLHISQPALSTSIAKLERELKVTLLHRGPTLFKLTPAGRLVYEFAAERNLHTRSLMDRLAHANHVRAVLRIGMIDSLAGILCDDTALLPELEQDHEVSLMVDNSAALLEAVRRTDIDYAVVVSQDKKDLPGALHQEPITDEPLLDVTLWPNAERAARLISYNRGSSTYDVVRDAINEFSLTGFHPTMYSTSPETMLRLVRLGRGHAVLPYSLVGRAVTDNDLKLYPIGNDGYARRPVSIVYRQRHGTVDIVRQRLYEVLHAQLNSVEKLIEPLLYD